MPELVLHFCCSFLWILCCYSEWLWQPHHIAVMVMDHTPACLSCSCSCCSFSCAFSTFRPDKLRLMNASKCTYSIASQVLQCSFTYAFLLIPYMSLSLLCFFAFSLCFSVFSLSFSLSLRLSCHKSKQLLDNSLSRAQEPSVQQSSTMSCARARHVPPARFLLFVMWVLPLTALPWSVFWFSYNCYSMHACKDLPCSQQSRTFSSCLSLLFFVV